MTEHASIATTSGKKPRIHIVVDGKLKCGTVPIIVKKDPQNPDAKKIRIVIPLVLKTDLCEPTCKACLGTQKPRVKKYKIT